VSMHADMVHADTVKCMGEVRIQIVTMHAIHTQQWHAIIHSAMAYSYTLSNGIQFYTQQWHTIIRGQYGLRVHDVCMTSMQSVSLV
jgi:hypothetical protein